MRRFALAVSAFLFSLALVAQNKTLRVDYVFTGTDKEQQIALDEMSCFDGWAGRNVNMDKVPVRGNGQISMTDAVTGRTIYRQSFSTLFQEWQTTEEATRVRKSFENVFLLPMPDEKVRIKVELYGFKGGVVAEFEHEAEPTDILIRHISPDVPQHKYLHMGGSSEECIDVAIVAEGYTADEAELFYSDAQKTVDALFSHAPFDRYKERFNFVAVALQSEDSGVSVPKEGEWKRTALSSHFSTFYSDRYLTTLRLRQMHDQLCGIPYEHIIILANTDTYGGGGIFNSYTLTTAHHDAFKPVVVHEFGHSFAGLADEYYYDDQYVQYYYPDVEPWEQNISTLKDFDSKWRDMLPENTDIPTESLQVNVWKKTRKGIPSPEYVGVYEGAGYQSKGVFRPYPDCRMHTNTADCFCPVCQRAIARIIEFYTE